MESDYAIAACRYIKRGLFLTCRYPAFSSAFVRAEIERPDTLAEELRDYRANSARAKRAPATLLLLVYISYSLKNLLLVYETMQLFDYNDYELNVRPVGRSEAQLRQMNYTQPSATLRSISCLISNCTRLSPPLRQDGGELGARAGSALLAADVGKLPLFLMCHPLIDRAYTPVDKLDVFGLLAFLVSMYTVFLLGACTTLLQFLAPAHNDAIMFITSPQVTLRRAQRRARELMRDLAISQRNYQRFAAWKRLAASKRHPDALLAAAQAAEQRRFLAAPPLRALRRLANQHALNGGGGGELKAAEQQEECREDEEPLVAAGLLESAPCVVDDSSGQLSQLIDDCLPIVRSASWRPQVARILVGTLAISLLYIGAMGIFFFAYVQLRVIRKRALLEVFAREMARRRCFVWPAAAGSLEPSRAFSIGQLDLTWTPYALWETATMNYLAAFSIAFMFAYYWMLVCEIGAWLAELRMFIVASLLVTRFRHDHERRQAEAAARLSGEHANEFGARPTGTSQNSSKRPRRRHFLDVRQFYKIANLREQFRNSLHLSHTVLIQRIEKTASKCRQNDAGDADDDSTAPLLSSQFSFHTLNSQDVDRRHGERFIAQMLRPVPEQLVHERQNAHASGDQEDEDDYQLIALQHDRTEFDIETLEQIYVNFRLLVDYIHSLRPSMTVVMAITYLLNYGYVFVAIICRRKFAGLNDETLSVIVFFFAIANGIIFMASNFHANAKKLQPLLWSIIAQLTYAKNLRVQHMRSLWLKQVTALDNEGGLGLRALGMRVTHVYIIQLIIWTATICALALKSHTQDE